MLLLCANVAANKPGRVPDQTGGHDMRNKRFTEFIAGHTKTAACCTMRIGKRPGSKKRRKPNRREIAILWAAITGAAHEVFGRSVPDQASGGR